MKFNKKNLDKLEPRKSNYFVMDDALENFGIRVYPSGKKVFSIRIRQNGNTKVYKVGNYPAMKWSAARNEAGNLIERYQNGEDVKKTEFTEKRKNNTLKYCTEEYLKSDIKNVTKKDIQRCIDSEESCWQDLIDKPMKDITEGNLLKIYRNRVKVAKNRARLEMAYLRSIWNFHKKNMKLSDSPTMILNEEEKGWNKTEVKTRRLDFETAPGFYKALKKLSLRDRSLFLMVHYTGMRISEVMGLRWSEVNLYSRSLHVPDTKNGRPLDIPLNSQAVNMLENMKQVTSSSGEFIFTRVNKQGKILAMNDHSCPMGAVKKQGVKWSPHDSRRGYIVAGGVLGLNNYIIKQLTNHYSTSDVHANYQHYTVAEMRETSQTIGDYLEKQLHSTNVVPFKKEA